MSGGGDTIQINNSENKVGALRVQSSTQGAPIALAYGLTRVTPNLIWYNDFTAVPHVQLETSGGGGKGGGGGGVQTTTTTYTYTVACLLGICEGPIGTYEEGPAGAIRRVWAGKEQGSPSSFGFNQFYGTGDQLPYSYVEAEHPTEAFGYRWTAYVGAGPLDLGSGTSIPNFTFEVYGLLNPSRCTPDVNPADVIEDFLTDPIHGAGWPEDFLGSLIDFRQYCYAANFLVAPAYAEQRPAADILKELAAIANSAVVWSDGLLKIKPYGDETVSYQQNLFNNGEDCCPLGDTYTWVPVMTASYDLTYDDFIAEPETDPIRVLRKRQSDAYNVVRVEILDRSNEYNIFVVEAEDLASIEKFGRRPAEQVELHAICDVSIGRTVAQAMLQRLQGVRNEYYFQLPWKYARLEPMDIVSLTDPSLGMNQYLVRITAVEEDEEGLLAITAEDLSLGSNTPGRYGIQPAGGTSQDSLVPPGNTAEPVIFQPPVELSGVPQIWIGAAGGQYWGGCEVWASDDDETYALLGTIAAPAAYGELTANFPAGPDPDTTSVLSVNLEVSLGSLSTFTESQADAGDSLAWVDGEIIAYTVAELVDPYEYELSAYIRRGLRCSFAGPHLTGSKFCKINATLGRFGINQARVGNTLYIKLLSFNIFGGAKQTLDDVSPYSYVVEPLGIVAANGVLPSLITAGQVLCIPDNTQMSLVGRMTVEGRINCDGRLIVL